MCEILGGMVGFVVVAPGQGPGSFLRHRPRFPVVFLKPLPHCTGRALFYACKNVFLGATHARLTSSLDQLHVFLESYFECILLKIDHSYSLHV